MSSLVPGLTLFPLYPGGRRLTTSNTGLGDASFRIAATNYSQAYNVNVNPEAQAYTGQYYTLNGTGSLTNSGVSPTPTYIQPLSLGNGNAGNYFAGSTVLAAADAPQIPAQYQTRASYYSVTDSEQANLMTLNEFRIPQQGLGIRVTTMADPLNPMGPRIVDNVSVAPSFQQAGTPLAATDAFYTLLNRPQITEGATFKSDPSPGKPIQPDGLNPLPNPKANLSSANIFQLDPNANPQGLNPPIRSTGLERQGDKFGLNADKLQTAGRNPVLDRLLQLQPRNQGLTIAGVNSDVTADTARKIATTQAKLDVGIPGETLARNLDALKTAAFEQGRLQTAKLDQQMMRQMDGFIPMAPTLPSPAKSGSDLGNLFGSLDRFDRALAGNGGLEDATSKKGSGGYIPFRMSSGGGGGEGLGGGFTGGFTQQGFGQQQFGSFSGGGEDTQQRRRQRQPLQMLA